MSSAPTLRAAAVPSTAFLVSDLHERETVLDTSEHAARGVTRATPLWGVRRDVDHGCSAALQAKKSSRRTTNVVTDLFENTFVACLFGSLRRSISCSEVLVSVAASWSVLGIIEP